MFVNMACYLSKMGQRAVTKGPVGPRVASNVRSLREDRHLTLDELSARLDQLGRPIQRSGLSKIEAGDRRVDADDLMALAVALDVTPNRLLLTADASEETVEITHDASTRVPRRTAWAWADGDDMLSEPTVAHMKGAHRGEDGEPWLPSTQEIRDIVVRFSNENRPHDPTPPLYFDDVVKHRALFEEFRDLAARLDRAGISIVAARTYAETAHVLDDDGRLSSDGREDND